MADKDKGSMFDAGLPQKPVSLDSKMPIQMTRKLDGDRDSQSSNASNGSYYFNVAQKGKLILPTALWIMLILAGICFLTLLASLNKSINALDTLVELEQEKSARALFNEHLHHRLNEEIKSQHKVRPSEVVNSMKANSKKGNDHMEEAKKEMMAKVKLNDDLIRDLEITDMGRGAGWFDMIPIQSSWFSMPSWTSLESSHHEQKHHDDRFRCPSRHCAPVLQAPSPSTPPASINDIMMPLPDSAGGVIVAMDGPYNPRPQYGSILDNNFLGSIFEQVMPLVNRFSSIDEQQHQTQADGRSDTRGGEDVAAPVTITAKVDNLNVHINSPQSETTNHQDNKKQTREEEISSLETSIDKLVAKLMDQKTQHNHNRQHNQPSDFHINGMLSHFIKKDMPQRHSSAMGPFSPLANLLMPFDSSSMFFQKSDGDESQQQIRNRHKTGPLDDNLADAQLIISITDDDETGKPSREINRHHVSNTRRPTFGQSPYEVEPLSPFSMGSLMSSFELPMGPTERLNSNRKQDHHITKASKDDAKSGWDSFANDLIHSLVSDMKDQNRKQVARDPKKNEQPEFNLIIDDGLPLVSGEQQGVIDKLVKPEIIGSVMNKIDSHSINSNKKADADHRVGPFNDLFSMIFGPPPASTFFMSKKDQEGAQLPKSTTATLVSQPSIASSVSSTTSLLSSNNIESGLKSNSSNSNETADEIKLTREEAEEILGDSNGVMQTSPQMAGEQQQADLSTPKATSPSNQGSSSNSTKESMVCECHKLLSNSTSIGRSSSGDANGDTRSSNNRSPSDRSIEAPNRSQGGSTASSSPSNSASSNSTSSKPSNSSSEKSSNDDNRKSSSSSQLNRFNSSDNQSPSSTSSRISDRTSSSSSFLKAEPLGYVPVVGRPENGPEAFIESSGSQLASTLAVSTQFGSNTTKLRVGATNDDIRSSPIANARPGSLLSAFNNGTNLLLPRLVNRLNNTNIPKFLINPS